VIIRRLTALITILFLISIISGSQLNDEGSLLAVLYHQSAAEYRALCYQAYNLATDRLKILIAAEGDKPTAVILDIDETVLDNSSYNAREVLKDLEYPRDFYEWIDSMEAEPVAGALEFLQLADSLGVKIFYITNRRAHKKKATMGNLLKYGLPQVNAEQVFCKTGESSKEGRRKQVMQDHEVLLLLGDNLIDFADFFDGKTIEERKAAVEKRQHEFGRKFIIFPNAMHGYWEKVINDFEYNLSPEQLQEKRLKHLKY
jgi:5'-nucleotidase (lipoprotein e(P4) family)